MEQHRNTSGTPLVICVSNYQAIGVLVFHKKYWELLKFLSVCFRRMIINGRKNM